MILSPFDPKAHHIQPFATNQKNFQKDARVLPEGRSSGKPQQESIETEYEEAYGSAQGQIQGSQFLESNKGVSSIKLNASLNNKFEFKELLGRRSSSNNTK